MKKYKDDQELFDENEPSKSYDVSDENDEYGDNYNDDGYDDDYDDEEDEEDSKLSLAIKIGAVLIGLIALGLIIIFVVNKTPKQFSSATKEGHSHVYSDTFTVDEPATCKKTGMESRHCIYEGCDAHIDDRSIPKVDHEFDDGKIVKEPTCTEEGEKLYKCKYCDETKTEPIYPIDHAFGPGQVKREATCTEPSIIEYECTRCGFKKEETGPSVQHDLNTAVFINEDDPLNIRYYRTCKNCGQFIYTDSNGNVLEGQNNDGAVQKDKHDKQTAQCELGNHDWATVKLEEATCDKEGKATYACRTCGKEKIETLPKKDHTFEESTVESTCEKHGSYTKKCKVCGYIAEEKTLELKDHNYSSSEVITEGDCSHDRVVRYKCSVCGKTKDETTSSSTGHTFEVSTYTENNQKITVDKCTKCGLVRSKVVTNIDSEQPEPESTESDLYSSVVVVNN